jgi:2-succinyl-6-hydroxy-2,4-cyclohexadiene-1-carboxylate synthase
MALLHGFTQTGACWPDLASVLAERHEVAAVDLPRHGRSGSCSGDLADTAAALADTIGPAILVGYSLGARTALTQAVLHPASVQALVLISGTAGIEDAEARAQRRAHDDALAEDLERDGVDAFLDRWLAQPFFADVPPERSCVDARHTNTAAGLAASLREAGQGVMEPLWDRLGAVQVPVLLVTGARDAAYSARAQRMATLLGGPTSHVVIPDAGHAAHLVDPAAVLDTLLPWLRAHTPSF